MPLSRGSNVPVEQSELSEGLGFLHQRGFRPLPSKGSLRIFEGELPCVRGPVRISIKIVDWDFTEYPVIHILQLPEGAPRLIPHVSSSGWFCYLASGSIILDRYDPASAIGQCLDAATKELDRLLNNPQYREGELQTEFGVSWSIGQEPRPKAIRLGTIGDVGKQVRAYYMGRGERQWTLVSSDPEEPDRIVRSQHLKEFSNGPPCWLFDSNRYPRIGADGLPTTVGALFSWLKSWDPKLYADLQRKLGEGPYKNATTILIIVCSPAGWFGFLIELDESLVLAFGRKPKELRQQLHTRRKNHPLMRISISEIGPDFIHSRNLLFPTLKGKTITLIGCGSIGSYLSQALVRLGAGTGCGKLRLVDPDILLADNLGRHLLGIESLDESKVSSLGALFSTQFPHAKIESLVRAALLPGDLIGDLIVNATGEEALSEAINHHMLRQPTERRAPVLHVWIAGQGEATQALWVDGARYACFRCMRQNDARRSPRFDLEFPQDGLAVVGCHAFTPYAVSAPMSASALAIDMISDWLQGDPSPRFRTRLREGSSARKIKNKNVEPREGCPACTDP